MGQILKKCRVAKLILSSLLILGGMGAGCGKEQDETKKSGHGVVYGEYVLGCGPTEQHHQFLAPLPHQETFPKQEGIRVTYKKSEFNSREEKKIEAAIQEWNSFHRSIFKKDLFTLEIDTRSPHAPYTSEMGCKFSGDAGVITIVRAKDDSEWAGAGMPSNSPGVTLRCSVEGEGLAKQILLLGPNNGRVGGDEQFQSVLVHELGHAIGLDHSCDVDDTTESRVHCSGMADESPFKQAVMFPYLIINFVKGENRHETQVKENLTKNDEERAQCILQAR